jgi:hypothetical protein
MRIIPGRDFKWRARGLYLGRHVKPVLTLVADATYPHLYRIRCPDGWMSTPANLSRAKDAAYGHARHLLTEETPVEPRHSREEALEIRDQPS